MNFWIPLVLLSFSIITLATLVISPSSYTLYHRKYRYRIRHIAIGHIATVLMGISAAFLGLNLLTSSSSLRMLVGSFLFFSGIQVTLWVIGIRFDFLGNKSTVEDSYLIKNQSNHDEDYSFISHLPYHLESLEPYEIIKHIQSLELPFELYDNLFSKFFIVLKDPILRNEFAHFIRKIFVISEELHIIINNKYKEKPGMKEELEQKLIKEISDLHAEIIMKYLALKS